MALGKDRHLKSGHPRGGYVQLFYDIYDSNAWRALDWSTQALWIAMRRRLKKSNNGDINAVLEGERGNPGLRNDGFTSSATVAKGLRALMAVGLIQMTRQGHLSQGTKVCSLYRFTDVEVFEHPALGIPAMKATNEWKEIRTLAHGKAIIKAAHEAAKTGKKREWSVAPKKQKRATPLQDLNRADSINELRASFLASNSEGSGGATVHYLKGA
jgi:hypothetical protein